MNHDAVESGGADQQEQNLPPGTADVGRDRRGKWRWKVWVLFIAGWLVLIGLVFFRPVSSTLVRRAEAAIEKHGRFARHEHDTSRTGIWRYESGRWLGRKLRRWAPSILEQIDVQRVHYNIEITSADANDALVEQIGALEDVRRLHLNAGQFTPECLDVIECWPQLEELKICPDGWTENDFARLGQIETLRMLRLIGDQPFKAKWLRHLTDVRYLCLLDLTDISLEGDLPFQAGELPYLRELRVTLVEDSESFMRGLASLSQLSALTIRGWHFTGTHLRELAAHSGFHSISLAHTGVTDRSVRELFAGWSRMRPQSRSPESGAGAGSSPDLVSALQVVDLSHTAVGNGTIEELRRLCDSGHARNLYTLNVAGTCVTGEALQYLAAVPLYHLDVSNCSGIGEGIASVSRIRSLHSLNLAGTDICGEDVGQLAALPVLTDLDLSSTWVGDAGVHRCTWLPWLRELGLEDSPVSQEAVEQLAEHVRANQRYLRMRLGSRSWDVSDTMIVID